MLYVVKSIVIDQPFAKVFEFVANPGNLPQWTNAFSDVTGDTAQLKTPAGTVTIGLKTSANPTVGNVDWLLTFPDSNSAVAYSRLSPLAEHQTLYSFTLTPPPAPLEELEGALAQQATILENELITLKALMEA